MTEHKCASCKVSCRDVKRVQGPACNSAVLSFSSGGCAGSEKGVQAWAPEPPLPCFALGCNAGAQLSLDPQAGKGVICAVQCGAVSMMSLRHTILPSKVELRSGCQHCGLHAMQSEFAGLRALQGGLRLRCFALPIAYAARCVSN